jgi:hypothetical protein
MLLKAILKNGQTAPLAKEARIPITSKGVYFEPNLKSFPQTASNFSFGISYFFSDFF